MAYKAVTLNLVRDGQCTPWGFRMSGGADIGTPLLVQKINFGSPATDGLQKGDVIVSISGQDARKMSHQKASDLIAKAGNDLKLVVARSSVPQPVSPAMSPTPGVPVTLYHLKSPPPTSPAMGPLLTPQGELLKPLPRTEFHTNDYKATTAAHTYQLQKQAAYEEREAIVNQAYRTLPLITPDLKAKQDVPIGSYLRYSRDTSGRSSGYRDPYMLTRVQEAILEAASTSPRTSFSSSRTSTPDISGYPLNPNVSHKQYNSPIHLYSNQALMDVINAQTSSSANPVNDLPRVQSPSKQSMDLSKSPTYQLIHEQEWKDLNKQKLEEHQPVENRVHNLEEIPKSGFNSYEDIHQSSSFKMLMSTLKSPPAV